jgi:hypothetical protein
MRETKCYYRPELLRDWKLGRLQSKWQKHDSNTFSKLDLSNAIRQRRKGYHFGEWFTARHYLRQGYEGLTEKWLHPSRGEKLSRAKEILGEAGVAYLKRRRKLGGSKPRKSPRPDLLVIKSQPTSFFFVEVKRDGDKLSRAQKRFFLMIERKFRRQVKIVKVLPRH